MLRRSALFAGLVLAFFPLTACGLGADATPNYRYRLTVEIDTPQGLRTGSSVIEVETDMAGENSIPTPGRVSHRIRGEAAAVDLGQGRVLFALLRSPFDMDWAGNVMFLLTLDVSGSEADRFLATFKAMLRRTQEIALPRYFRNAGHIRNRPARPMLVTFADLDDPTSVAAVDPDDLAASFGDGVSLRRITVQLTDDPVTVGIEDRLGWLPNYYDKMLDGQRINNSQELANNLNQGAFSQGVLK